MIERKPFPLTRYFVATSLVTTLVITGITSLVSFEQIRKDLLLRARNDAVRMIRHLQDDIHEDFIVPTLARSGSIDLDDPRQFAALDAVVRRIADRFDIINIYLFDDHRRILYSTQPRHVGLRTPDDNVLYDHAVSGTIASEVRERGAPLDIAPGGAQTSLLETYVPVQSLAQGLDSGGPVQNVIETYQDLDVYQEGILLTQSKIVAFAFSGAAVLFLVLFWIVRRADQFIHERSQALVESNRQLRELSESLEREVQRRSRELVQKEKLASLGTLTAGLAHEVRADGEGVQAVVAEQLPLVGAVARLLERAVAVEVVAPAGELEALIAHFFGHGGQFREREIGPLAGEQGDGSWHDG